MYGALHFHLQDVSSGMSVCVRTYTYTSDCVSACACVTQWVGVLCVHVGAWSMCGCVLQGVGEYNMVLDVWLCS